MADPYPVGTEVEKIESQPGNGEVVPRLEFGYFVQWRDFPVPVFIRGSRLALRKKPHAS